MLSVLPIEATNRKLHLVAAADRLLLNGEEFLLSDIDQVAWSEMGQKINNAYQGRMFLLDVKAGDRHGRFVMPGGGHKDKRLDECRAWFDPVVALLEEAVVPRLTTKAIAAIEAGEAVPFPPGVSADRRGVRHGMVWKRVLPWSRIVGTQVYAGPVWLRTERPGKEPKRSVALNLHLYNLAVLKRLITHYNPAAVIPDA